MEVVHITENVFQYDTIRDIMFWNVFYILKRILKDFSRGLAHQN